MRAHDEAEAFAAVMQHLQQRFPRMPEVRISTAVDAERQRFADARIREFVPLLAERAAAAHLQAAALDPVVLPG